MATSLTLPDRKRLEVARALATAPKLLLLDEVMAGLRPTETDRMVAILRELNAQGPHHPADRARDARRDGAREPRAGAASRRGDRARARPRRWCASRRWSNPISARRRSDALRREHRCVLRRRAGARRRFARGGGGRDRRHRRRERRGQDLADPHHRRHEQAGARRDPLSRHRHRGLAELPGLQSRHRAGGGRPPGVSDAHGRGKSRHGRDAAAREGAARRKTASACSRCFRGCRSG